MKEEFLKYVSNYDLNDKDIKLKYNHSIRVMDLSEKYAKLLGFNENDIYIAKIIGLLHDIGRFEQLKVYHTYYDSKSIDHSEYGLHVLFDEGLIERFNVPKEDYDVIKYAIFNHNKLHLEPENDERKLIYAKLIRDVDKIDIIYLEGFLHEIELKSTSDKITKELYDSVFKHTQESYDSIKNKNDEIVQTFTYAFDVNNNVCLEELKQNYKYFYDSIIGKEVFKDIYEEVIRYIDERIGKKC